MSLNRHVEDLKDQAIWSIMQYLQNNGFDTTLEVFQDECKRLVDDMPMTIKPNTLESALTALADKEAATAQHGMHDEKRKVDSQLRVIDEAKEQIIGELQQTISGVHNANIIDVQFSPQPDTHWVISGGVDRVVNVVDYRTSELVASVSVPAPILSLNVNPANPSLVLATCLNGQHLVVDLSKAEGKGPNEAALVQEFKDHTSYVVCGKWSPDGRFFATCSRDKSLHIYGESGESRYSLKHDVTFPEEVICCVWLKDSEGKLKLLVSVRDDNYLHEFDMETMTESNKYNMNDKQWDDHVSFAALEMSVSPNGEYLLVSTDRHRIIMYQLGTMKQIRNFYGCDNGQYSTPRHLWSRSGKYIYSTSEDNKVYAWDVLSAKVVNVCTAHSKTVRGFCMHPHEDLLATCSYDRTVNVWSTKA